MTLSQLAKLANVSVSTASKAFSGSHEVNDQTREAIFSIARANGCFKKFFNAKYPKFVVALICPEVHSRHYAEICFAIQRALHAKNCEICVSTTDFSERTVIELIGYYEKYSSVDAIVLIDSPFERDFSHEIPIVSFGKKCNAANLSIVTNCEHAVGDALAHLLHCGAKTIGFIGERLTEPKKRVFEQKLRELTGADPSDDRFVYVSERRFQEGGIEGAKALYESGNLPDALLCAYDDMAFGAIRFLTDVGISVPRDLLVIGMDDTPNANFFCPRLSSIGYDTNRIAEEVAEGIFALLAGEPIEKSRDAAVHFSCRESSIPID